MTTKEILLGAADTLEEHGWLQGRFGNSECGFCAGGAINHAAVIVRAHLEGAEACRAFADHLYSKGLSRSMAGGIVAWNDAHGRTKTEVVATLREAAEAL